MPVLEAFLPFGALLAGAGFGDLIRKIVFVGKGGGEVQSDPYDRPRIQVTGPKVKPEICQICMGRIKEGSEYVRCSNGKVFHSVCLARVGNCPYCRRTTAIKGKEGTTSREYVVPIIPAHAEVASPEAALIACPVCGSGIEADATGCRSCGAIFVAEGGTFPCPGCGHTVNESDLECHHCGEPFHQFRPRACPVCGSIAAPNAEGCACGAILDDRCPECGAVLPADAVECAGCGAAFEFV